MAKTRGPEQLALAVLLAAASVAYVHWYITFYSQYPTDDAFIHLRIARNFVEQGRPYYNPDQAVAGSSSVFWTLCLTLLFKLFGVRLSLLPLTESIFTVGVFAVGAWLLAERRSVPSAIVAAFLIVSSFLLHVSAGLMETPAALLFFLSALVCVRTRRPVALGFFSGMAFLVRYEFAVWLLVALLYAGGSKERKAYVLGTAVPLLVCLAFNWLYFGALIPNTVWAKSRVYAVNVSEFVSLMGVSWISFLLFTVASGALLVHTLTVETAAWIRATVLFALPLFGLYCVSKTFMFTWYWPLVLVPLVLGTAALPSRHLYVLLLLVIALRSFPIAAAQEAYGLAVGNPSFFREFASAARVRQYLRIGDDLSRLSPQAVLMSSEIGALGWTFRGRIIDAAGLVSPECLKYHPMKVPEERSNSYLGAIPPQAVRELAPDLVVSMEAFSEAFRRELVSGRIGNYVLLREYPVIGEEDTAVSGRRVLWGSRSIHIFVRQ